MMRGVRRRGSQKQKGIINKVRVGEGMNWNE